MKTNINLQPYNSFGFDAVAKQFVEINAVSDLQTLIKSGALPRQKTLILSGGNNILFQNEVFDGLVIYINTKGIEIIMIEKASVAIVEDPTPLALAFLPAAQVGGRPVVIHGKDFKDVIVDEIANVDMRRRVIILFLVGQISLLHPCEQSIEVVAAATLHLTPFLDDGDAILVYVEVVLQIMFVGLFLDIIHAPILAINEQHAWARRKSLHIQGLNDAIAEIVLTTSAVPGA